MRKRVYRLRERTDIYAYIQCSRDGMEKYNYDWRALYNMKGEIEVAREVDRRRSKKKREERKYKEYIKKERRRRRVNGGGRGGEERKKS